MSDLKHYLVSISLIQSMRNKGIISEDEYNKSEAFLAKKYCIKTVSIYRPNDLIKSPFRVINVC